jgi:hypothetical protein
MMFLGGLNMTNQTAIQAAFLVLATLALGCDSEGAVARMNAPDATLVEEPGEGPGRGGSSTVFTVPDVQAVTVPQDAGTVTPDTMPMVTPDAMIAVDTRPVVAVDTMPAAPSMAVCKAPKVHMANVCQTGYWPGTQKPCVQSGQDKDGVVYGAIVKVGEQPCAAYAVGTAPYYSADVIVIPAGGCDFYCPKSSN